MVFNYRKIDSPTIGTIYIGLNHLICLMKKNRHYLQIYKMFIILMNCHPTLCYCVHSHSKLSVSIYQNKIFVIAVALNDTQVKIPLKHCFHQHASPACIVAKVYTVL